MRHRERLARAAAAAIAASLFLACSARPPTDDGQAIGDSGSDDDGEPRIDADDGGARARVDAASSDVDQDDTSTIDALNGDALPDAARPDGRPIPPFAECAPVGQIANHLPPRAIFEVTALAGSIVSCHCGLGFTFEVGRVLCGSLDGVTGVGWRREECHAGGPVPPLPSIPAIFALQIGCSSAGLFTTVTFPANDWDALLAEQIAGHGGDTHSGPP